MRSQTVQAAWDRLSSADPTTHLGALVELLCDEAEQATDPAARAERLADAAQICHRALNDVVRAQTLWTEAFEADAGDRRSIAALADLAEAAEDWVDAERWLVRWRALLTPEEPAWMLATLRLIRVQQDALGQAPLGLIDAALAVAPDDLGLMVRRQLLVTDTAAERARFDDRLLELVAGPARRAALLLARGHRRLAAGDLPGAKAAFEAALRANPASGPAREALVRVLAQAEDWPALVRCLEAAVAEAEPGPERGRAAYVAGLYADGRLGDQARAQALFSVAVASLGEDRVAARELVRWSGAGLADRLAAWADDADPAEAAVGAYLQGLAAEREGRDADAAAAHQAAVARGGLLLAAAAGRRRAKGGEAAFAATTQLFELAETPAARQALATHAGHLALRAGAPERADGWFAKALSHAPARGPIWAAMRGRVDAHRLAERWTELAALLTGWLADEPSPAVQAWAREALAGIEVAQLDAEDAALTRAQAALAEDPACRWARQIVERAAFTRADPEAAALLSDLAAQGSAEQRAICAVRAGDHALAAEDHAGAEAAWRDALIIDPSFLPALVRLGPALTEAGRHDEMLALYAAELAALPTGARRAEAAGRVAMGAETHGRPLEACIDAYERWWAEAPDSPFVLDGLVRLYGAAGRWTDQAEVLRRREAALGGELGRNDRVRAGLAHVQVGARSAAAADFEAALAAPYDAAVSLLIEAGVARLDDAELSQAVIDQAVEQAEGATRQAALHKQAHTKAGALDALVGEGDLAAAWIQLRHAAEAGDLDTQWRAAARLSELLEAGSGDAWAVACLAAELAERAEASQAEQVRRWERVLALHPPTARAWEGLLAAQADAPAECAALWVRYARQVEGPRARAAALAQAALLEEARGPSGLADALLDEAAEADSAGIFALWLRYDPGENDPRARIELLLTLAGRLRSPRDQARALYEAGLTARSALDADPSPFLLEAARRDPASEALIEQIVEQLGAQARHAEVAEVLGLRADWLEGPEAAVCLQRLAEVQIDRLKDRPAARQTWLRIVGLTPEDGAAWAQLGDVCFGLEAFAEAAAHYGEALALAPEPAEAARMHLRVGRMQARQLGEADAAIGHLEEAARLHDPEGRAAEALAEVLLTNGQPDRAATVYAELASEPHKLSARAGLVRALMTAGRVTDAAARLRVFREADPADPLLMILEQELEASGALDEALAAEAERLDVDAADPLDLVVEPEAQPLDVPEVIEAVDVEPVEVQAVDAEPPAEAADDVIEVTAPDLLAEISLDAAPSEAPAPAGSLELGWADALGDEDFELPELPSLSPPVEDPAAPTTEAEAPDAADADELPEMAWVDTDLEGDEALELGDDWLSAEPTEAESGGVDLALPAASVELDAPDLDAELDMPLSLDAPALDAELALSLDAPVLDAEAPTLDAPPLSLPPLAGPVVSTDALPPLPPLPRPPRPLAAEGDPELLAVLAGPDDGAFALDPEPEPAPPQRTPTLGPAQVTPSFAGALAEFEQALEADGDVIAPAPLDALAALAQAPVPFEGAALAAKQDGPVATVTDAPKPAVYTLSPAPEAPEPMLDTPLAVESLLPLDEVDDAPLVAPTTDAPAESGELGPWSALGAADETGLAFDEASIEAATRPPATPPPVPSVQRMAPLPASRTPADQAANARSRISRDPLDAQAWRSLREASDPRAQPWLDQVIAWIEGAPVPEVDVVLPTEPVPERLRRGILPESVPPNLLLLLRSVGSTVAPAFSPVQGRRRGGRRVPDHEPLFDLVRRVGRVLEVPPVQVVVDDDRPYTIGIEAGTPSRLLLGSAVFEGAGESGVTFLVARALGPLREGTVPARALSDREFRAFLGALFEMLQANYPIRARDRGTVDRVRGWLDPLLAVHQRLAWEPLAQAASVGLSNRSAAGIRAGLELYGARLALSVADGFAGALEMLRLLDFDDRPRGEISRADLAQFLADNDIARDLLVFAGSSACLAVRRWRRQTGDVRPRG